MSVGLLAAVTVGPLALGNQYYLQILVNVGVNIILVLGINIITGIAGQLSLCQGAFFAIGAYTSALLVLNAGLSFWLSLPVAAIMTAFIGVLVGIPSLRLRGHYLAMVTIAFAVIVQQILTNWSSLTRGPSGLIGIPWPDPVQIGPLVISIQSRETYYVFVVAVVFGAIVATQQLLRSRLGKSLLAVREDEVAAELMGIDTQLCKLLAFSLSAMFAGVAGVLYAHFAKILTPDEFGIFESVSFLLMLIIGGSGSVAGSVVGAATYTILPEALRVMADYRLIVFGGILIFIVIFSPGGLVGAWQQLRRHIWPSGLVQPAHASVPSGALLGKSTSIAGRKGHLDKGLLLLEIHGVSKQFGGLTAISSVDIDLRRGEILGLIGPNGSGKTTLINLISGVYQPSEGAVRLEGVALGGLRPSAVSQAGVSRTFQKVRLFRDLTVYDNVAVALAPDRVPRIAGRLWKGRVIGQPDRANDRIAQLLTLVGLEKRTAEQARTLSYGEQRFLELARALATRPKVLLLDEPAAGLSAIDVSFLKKILTRLQASGIGIILVEHHLEFVMKVATRIVVFNYGEKIFEGEPENVQRDPAVIEAYLGSEDDDRFGVKKR